MSETDAETPDPIVNPSVDDYPLRRTAEVLNDRLGLYLSEEQQRGLAIGLLVGVTLGAALVSWSVGNALRRDG